MNRDNGTGNDTYLNCFSETGNNTVGAGTYYIEIKRDGGTLTYTMWTGSYGGTQVG